MNTIKSRTLPPGAVRVRPWGMWFLLVVLAAACGGEPSPEERLEELLAEVWEFELQANPLLASRVGRREYDDRLPRVDETAQSEPARRRSAFLERLQEIDPLRLPHQSRINYRILEHRLEDDLARYRYRAYLVPITVDTGFHISFAQLPGQMPFRTVRDYENYLARLRGFADYARQHIALMRRGLETGITLPRVTLEGYEETVRAQLVEDPRRSVFYSPFSSFPPGMSEADRQRLGREGAEAIRDSVLPGYQEFLEFLVEEYVPGARETIGASDLPDGKEYYAHLVRHFTTLEVSPEQVHQLGLQEVARIEREMAEVIRQAGFQGGFADFLRFLRTDPRFYPNTAEDLLKEAAFIAKRMDGRLPSLFQTLPRLPYGIEPVPDHLAPKYTGGRYRPPAEGSREAGFYWVNTYQLNSRPLYVLESLTFHEAVPGHHLQFSLARELENLPELRRFAGIAAFSEGWALYAERLGLEAGFYTDPYRNFGRLTYEMWRACRLVVDTGIHTFGWTRPQVLDYLASKTALSLHEVRTETDRYISTPGQALAYKMGELKIRQLREKAEAALGEKFDVREFHDAVLLDGPLPLTALEENIQNYIDRTLQER